MKHQIKLAYIREKAVEDLDEEMDQLQNCQFIVVQIDAKAEKKPGISPVDYLVRPVLCDVGPLAVPRRDATVNLIFDFVFFVRVKRNVPLGKASLTLPILEQDKANHNCRLTGGRGELMLSESGLLDDSERRNIGELNSWTE